MARTGVIGWKLPKDDRERLLEAIPPAYSEVIADHVTLRAGVTETHPVPSATSGRVVGVADDGDGVQALVVEINGTTDRPDGSIYHITWSLDRVAGRKPVQSNDIIREHGWTSIEPLGIALRPQFYRS